jgi:hypothetical protein
MGLRPTRGDENSTEKATGLGGCVRTANFREKPQVPPLRCASVGMTILWVVGTVRPHGMMSDLRFPLVDENASQFPNRIVIPTEA